MLEASNVLILDEPTDHLDLESIQALNKGLTEFTETILFCSHDHQFTETIANRIIDVTPGQFYDKQTNYDSYVAERFGHQEG